MDYVRSGDASHPPPSAVSALTSFGLTLRRGLRWHISPKQPFRYPSLQLSFPHLFPRLSSSGWSHSFTQTPELTGLDLHLGDLIHLTDTGPRVIGNFHSELSISSGVRDYVEPNVDDFTSTGDAVQYVLAIDTYCRSNESITLPDGNRSKC
jgi:hypothetical protein